MAIKISEIKSVMSFRVKSVNGINENNGIKLSPMPRALLVTINPSLKPSPVALTTPTTIPIAAQTAPTERAYLHLVRLQQSNHLLRCGGMDL